MSLATEYAARFSRWARNRREAMSRVYRCEACGATGPELLEHDGKLWCPAHDPRAIEAARTA